MTAIDSEMIVEERVGWFGLKAKASHVVILNWRDSRHPQAGGAELYAESVARRMARHGTKVTFLTSAVRDAPVSETVEGVEIRRRGSRFTVYLHALLWLWRHRAEITGVIDFQNGIPFFAPLTVPSSTPIVCVVFHVHQEQFNTYFPWPMNRIGQWLEGPVARWVYGQRALVVISPSTRTEVRHKLRLKGPIFVVPCGMDVPVVDGGAVAERAPTPRIACVGRLMPHKQMNLLIASLPEVLAEFPQLKIDIMGTGTVEETLKSQAVDLGVDGAVSFHGKVSDETRDRLFAEAWLTVNPSAGEGWGLSVLEANACGIPAVAFRVPGLQDAVVDGETGWLVEKDGSLSSAITKALQTLSNPEQARGFRHRAIDWAGQFNWEWTTLRIEALLGHEADRLGRLREGNSRDPRAPTDLACRVDLPANANTLAAIRQVCRRTDVWRRHEDQITALLHGADEDGVRVALRRAGVVEQAQIRPARSGDWLLGGVPPEHGDA
jgi:glycosyltransferase involved in cell wall biosynthesis